MRLFFYTVMSFELKNTRATYQRLMNQIFKHQIGCNIEVYMNNILIKSTQAENLINDIEETCSTLRRYSLKLNPSKCLFIMKSDRFLRYIITERGIEVNFEKV